MKNPGYSGKSCIVLVNWHQQWRGLHLGPSGCEFNYHWDREPDSPQRRERQGQESEAQSTQDAGRDAQRDASKWDLLIWMGVSTLHASNIKGKMFEFAHASRPASCVDWASKASSVLCWLPHSVYAMRHSTPAAALMSETCFRHNRTQDLKAQQVNHSTRDLSAASPVWNLCVMWHPHFVWVSRFFSGISCHWNFGRLCG